MKIKENSVLNLYKNVDITSGVQIAFKSKENQAAYFAKQQGYKASKFYYIRRNGHIKVEMPIGNVMECNYLSFKNPDFENKVFYGKIINAEYVSNKVTEITYAVDYFQTYMFDVNYRWGNINREHLSEDDYNKSIKNPYDPTIYEFYTAENLPSSRELEIFYSPTDIRNIPDISVDDTNFNLGIKAGSESVFLFISDFDESAFPNIRSQFYDYFDFAVDASGRLIATTYESLVTNIYFDVHVGRGYGIYQIQMDKEHNGESGGTVVTPGAVRLKHILNWLTNQGLENNIIGGYQTSTIAFLSYITNSFKDKSLRKYLTQSVQPPGLDVDSRKLYLSPFTYIRVYNNEGDCKEFHYEKFLNYRTASDIEVDKPEAEFVFLPLLDGSPMTSLAPASYMKLTNELVNTEERIDCRQIPQIGYTTDAYLSFIATQMTMNIASRTNTVSEQFNQKIDEYWKDTQTFVNNNKLGIDNGGYGDFFKRAVNGLVGQSLRQSASGVNAFIGSGGGSDSGLVNINAMGEVPLANLRGESATWRSGMNYESRVLGPAKSAFVADEYHAGSTNGSYGTYLLQKREPGTFTIQTVRLHPTILKLYDEFFKGYGYTSNRIGTPRVCNYITGIGEQPHFANFQGKELTYIKTSSMVVEYCLADVCDNIESMFNSGIQLLKGESL